MIEDTPEERILPRKTKAYLGAREPQRRARLHRLIVADCSQKQIAADLGCSVTYVRYLISANGFGRLWSENRERRKQRRKLDPSMVRQRMKLSKPILQEFQARGYRVIMGRVIDECRLEGFGVSCFAPKKPITRNTKAGPKKYFLVESNYLDRFIIVKLSNGKKVFRWPRKAGHRWLYIPEWELHTPEEWPSKADFRRQRELWNLERGFKRKITPKPSIKRENSAEILRKMGLNP